MVLKLIGELIVADGNPVDLAMYTHTLLEIFKMKAEFDKKQEDLELLKRFGDFNLGDLLKMELGNTEKQEDEDGGKTDE